MNVATYTRNTKATVLASSCTHTASLSVMEYISVMRYRCTYQYLDVSVASRRRLNSISKSVGESSRI